MKWSWKIGRILGVDVFLHTTFVFLFVGMGLWWIVVDKETDPSREILFLGIIVGAAILHEISHAIAARILGFRTREIVLLPFAGASRLDRRPTEPFHAFLIAISACAVHFAITAGVLVALLAGGSQLSEIIAAVGNDLAAAFATVDPAAAAAAARGPSLAVEILEVNLAFGLFNLLPAYPMDGGPALRAILSAFTDSASAARLSGKVGSFVAVALAIGGLLFNNIVLAMVGFFVFLSGRQESTFAAARLMLEGLRVRAAMTTQYITIATYESLEHAANLLLRSTQSDFPVVGDDGRFMGMLTRNDLLREMSQRGPMGRVIDAARRGERILSPDEKLDDLLEQFSGFPQGSMPVLEEGKLVGILSAEGVQKLLMVRDVTGRSSSS
jgi:stage IV sporulation protein FB